MAEPLETNPLKELLEKVFPEETAEAAYRRGYRDGFIVSYRTMPDGSDAAQMREWVERLFRYWQGPLLEWEKAGREEGAPQQPPPALPGLEAPA